MKSTKLTSRKHIKIYTEKDFKSATTQMERMYMYIMQPGSFHLNDKDYNKLMKLEHTWTICYNEISKVQATRKVAELYAITSHQARKLIGEAEELFAPLFSRGDKMSRIVLLEQMNLCYKLAITTNDIKTAVKVLTEINKLREKEDNLSAIIEALQLPEISFTDDPKVLEIEEAEIGE